MSKGNRIIGVRLPKEMLDAIDVALVNLEKSNQGDLKISEWIRLAICEKLDKLERGRSKWSNVTWSDRFWYKWSHR